MPTVPRIFTRRFEPSLGVIHWRACACVSRVLSAAANCSAGAGRACVQALPLNKALAAMTNTYRRHCCVSTCHWP